MFKPTVQTGEERRAVREQRRVKQRLANIGRAARMHAARLIYERKISTPASQPGRVIPQFNVGCSGWFYWHWRSAFYPHDLPTKNWFAHYAKHFKTVELNAPFYSWPTPATVSSWLRQAGRRKFIYTVKVSELITHVKRFTGTRTLVRDFGHIADLLGPRMGCFLFQLPPSFSYSRARLDRILRQLDANRRNVVEFRHPTWWREEVFTGFRNLNIIFCSCSGPRLPDGLIKAADEVYVRFHGIKHWYRHDYTGSELGQWMARIRGSNATRVWAYFNNDRDGHAIKNARTFLHQLRLGAVRRNKSRVSKRARSPRQSVLKFLAPVYFGHRKGNDLQPSTCFGKARSRKAQPLDGPCVLTCMVKNGDDFFGRRHTKSRAAHIKIEELPIAGLTSAVGDARVIFSPAIL